MKKLIILLILSILSISANAQTREELRQELEKNVHQQLDKYKKNREIIDETGKMCELDSNFCQLFIINLSQGCEAGDNEVCKIIDNMKKNTPEVHKMRFCQMGLQQFCQEAMDNQLKAQQYYYDLVNKPKNP